MKKIRTAKIHGREIHVKVLKHDPKTENDSYLKDKIKIEIHNPGEANHGEIMFIQKSSLL